SMRVKAKLHQKMGSSTANGGISHNGMVNSQPRAKRQPTQMAFQLPTAVEYRPWRDTPSYSPFSRWRNTMGMTKMAAMTRPRMPEMGSRMPTASRGTR